MEQPTYSPSALPYKIQAKIRVDDCWLWTGFIANGYGRMVWPPKRRARQWLAHRLVWTLLVGPIPDGLVLDHLCQNRACCNPAHLEVVTSAENIRRANAKRTGRRNVNGLCRKGLHPWIPANIYTTPSTGEQSCRGCNEAAQRRWVAAGRRRQARPGSGQGSLLD